MFSRLQTPKFRFANEQNGGRTLRKAVKILGGAVFMAVNTGFLYYWWTREEVGRQRAIEYYAKHGPRKKTQLLPDELQPEYVRLVSTKIDQQRAKFQRIVREKAREQQHPPK